MALTDYAGPGILSTFFETCTLLDRVTVNTSDGQFGIDETWTDGAKIELMIEKNASPEVVVAERQGMREQYIVVCRRGMPLKRGDVFRRDKNGETLIVKSTPNDREAPDVSTVQIARFEAERWDMPARP